LFIILVSFTFSAIIEQEVFEELSKKSFVDVNVLMKIQIDWNSFDIQLKGLDHITKGRKIVDKLMYDSLVSQPNVRRIIENAKLTYTNLWINNMVSVKQASNYIIEKNFKIR